MIAGGRGVTDVLDGCQLLWALDGDLVHGEVVHVITGANMIFVAKENLLELGDVWGDIAVLVIPLVLGRVTVPLAVVQLAVVVDSGDLAPASLLGLGKRLSLRLSGGLSLGLVALTLRRGGGRCARRCGRAAVVGTAEVRHGDDVDS